MIPDFFSLFLCSLVSGLEVSDPIGYTLILKKEIDRVVQVVPNISKLAPGNGDWPRHFYFDSLITAFKIGCMIVLQNSEILGSIVIYTGDIRIYKT